ncbi:ABC transporter substrate-binding protein [Sulfitobacter sp. D35]|uniref:ABC transporter substrate-binding protein n=1 Tax=Sulfitobacter sp. D35 TaxID=3083252 RepID=UPI00296E3268|nr:ABC transporter substrate-binding protein [Sulfitobacter sp. D35]MDW4498837.1 ABC transporter substrate-binding protein [Sulfitobacter sp. D35]
MSLPRFSAAVAALTVAAVPALAQNDCAAGKTLDEGTLTVATGNPAYYPWVIDDVPEKGEGFEAAMAYALADRMGFSPDAVTWVRTSFDEAIQPGEKSFDINLQQYSITEDRDKVVDFSTPYYTAPMAVVVPQAAVDAGLGADLSALKDLKWGIVASTTALPVVMEMIAPASDPLIYDDNANVVEAMKANQIDAALFDLPTALYVAAVMLEDGAVLGQFAPEQSENPDRFGMLMEEGNALKDCVDAALAEMEADGTLKSIEQTWLQEATGVPLIQ